MIRAEDMRVIQVQRTLSRRSVMQALGGAALLSAGGFALPAEAQTISDVNIFNFALNLEYLEAEFYLFATTGEGLDDDDTDGVGEEGRTRGGAQVEFEDPLVEAVATEIAADEVAHVRFLRKVLGRRAIAKPAIALDALEIGFGDENEFLILARAFEDVGVSAYAGAARLIKNKTNLEAAARILATEAYHAGNIRYQVVARELEVPEVDDDDQAPTAENFFPTDRNGLAVTRTATEVARIVRGSRASGGAFFPKGLNGVIR